MLKNRHLLLSKLRVSNVATHKHTERDGMRHSFLLVFSTRHIQNARALSIFISNYNDSNTFTLEFINSLAFFCFVQFCTLIHKWYLHLTICCGCAVKVKAFDILLMLDLMNRKQSRS